MKLPDIWGPGSIFAYSGLDGENSYHDSLVGLLSGDGIGIIFQTENRRELRFPLLDISDFDFEIVASDLIRVRFADRRGGEERLDIVFWSQDTVIGRTGSCAPPVVFCWGELERENGDGVIVHRGSEYTALATEQEEDGGLRFAFSKANNSPREAVEKAKEGLSADLGGAIEAKMQFFRNLPGKEGLDPLREKTLYKAFSILKSQVYSPTGMLKTRWTTPDRLPHRRMWLWDSVFHALGNKHISPELAYETIRAVLFTQREDGFIAHSFAPPNERSSITQPPVLAWGLYELYMHTGNKDILKESYPSLKRYIQWNMENRDTNENYLYEWKINTDSLTNRCDECGMDNSPRFDDVEAMDCIDFSCFMANEARCLREMACELGLGEEEEYWAAIYSRIKDAINGELWDEQDKLYYDRRLADGGLKKVRAVSSFLPLFAGVCDQDRAEYLAEYLSCAGSFYTTLPVSTISASDPTYGTDMWRGPVWINYNYMVWRGLQEYGFGDLAADIVDQTVDAVAFWYDHDGVIYEYYDSENRVSPSRLNRKGEIRRPYDHRVKMQCIRDYGWSAALYVDMILGTTRSGKGRF